ncbi:MAG: membrane protein insertion efficiency factor YidD [Moraxella sp.]|nr:membrane protein insertion efficiency factor YidD [Moraxella sp.]
MRKFLLLFIKIYQKAISPLLPARCRYYPTCSNYAHTALRVHSLPKALWLIIKRLARCQPFGGSGVDFVPVPMARFYYKPCLYRVSFVKVDKKSYRGFLTHLIKKGYSGFD